MALQIIAARKPFYNDQFDDEFNWWITIFVPIGIGSEQINLLVIKRSPTVGLNKPLRLNVSALAEDYFNHIPVLTTPTTIDSIAEGEYVGLNLMADGYDSVPFGQYRAYDGWVPFADTVVAVSNLNAKKFIFRDSPQYIQARAETTNNIIWLLDDGQNQVTSRGSSGSSLIVFPVIHPNLNVDETNNNLTIIGRDVGNNELWRVEYEFVCPYDEKHTIGFINKYGAWEFIDVSGNKKTMLKTKRDSFSRFTDGVEQAYGINGNYEYEFNTGWVEKGFEDVIEGLMLSRDVVLYKGDGTDPIALVIDENDIDIQDSRTNKMINYNFKAKVGAPVIPIT